MGGKEKDLRQAGARSKTIEAECKQFASNPLGLVVFRQ